MATATTKKATTASATKAANTAAKTPAEKGYTLKIIVKLYGQASASTAYIAGNIAKLGDWNATKAKAMKADATCESFTLNVTGIKKGTEVAFKVIRSQDWATVEKGANGEEIENHIVTVDGPAQIEVGVMNWGE